MISILSNEYSILQYLAMHKASVPLCISSGKTVKWDVTENKTTGKNELQGNCEIFYEILSNNQGSPIYYLLCYDKGFKLPIARFIFKEIVLNLYNLHNTGVAHLNLTIENICIGKDGKITFQGFEHAVLGAVGKYNKKTAFLTRNSTRAPETLKKEFNSNKADIFSLGVTLFALVFRSYPHVTRSNTLTLEKIENYRDAMSENPGENIKGELEDLVGLLNGLLCYKPAERLSIAEIISHPWMNKRMPLISEINEEVERRKLKIVTN